MQISLANSLEAFLQTSSQKLHSSERVLTTFSNGTLIEWNQNGTEWMRNR